MATERIVDLEHQRYADRPYEGPLPVSGAAEAEARDLRQHQALGRLKAIAADHRNDATALTGAQLRDLLTVLGLDE